MKQGYDYEMEIAAIRASGNFVMELPPGCLTNELCLAAFHQVSRRTVLKVYFNANSAYAVPHHRLGNRRVCETDAIREMGALMNSVNASVSRRGGARRRTAATCKGAVA
jgi:hypothetical protein